MLKRNKIIIADDDEGNIRMASRAIGRFFPDLVAETFVDGTSLEYRLNGNLDDVMLVFTDNQMPGVKGGEIIARYAKKPEFEKIPFILFHLICKFCNKNECRCINFFQNFPVRRIIL